MDSMCVDSRGMNDRGCRGRRLATGFRRLTLTTATTATAATTAARRLGISRFGVLGG
ncbi:MAG: hypothetical protein JWR10_4053, partial [Rubritepida sp.]|nr:hypothetical protein [Rubritepida sp.]